MINFRILILIIIVGLTSCSEQKYKSELPKVKKKSTTDYEEYDRFWITYKYLNNISEKVEVYVSKKNDTINNQIKFLNNDVIDSTKSRFFEFKLVKSDKLGTYDGVFHFYSENDNNPNNVDKEKTLSLSIFQKSRDSSYVETFESKASNTIEFKLVNYKNDQLVGIMSEIRFIQEYVKGKDMLNMIKTTMAVDNKSKTHNIGIKIFGLNKR